MRCGHSRLTIRSALTRSVARMSTDTTKPEEVDPETKTDSEGKPVENPSG